MCEGLIAGPGAVNQLLEITDPVARVAAAWEFIARRAGEDKEIRRIRNDAVRQVCADLGPAQAARVLGMKLPTVMSIWKPQE